jgi:ATP-binding cassette, subfamily F, member 3
LRRLDVRINDDDRIALLGQNGNGKSTLVKLLSARLAPMSGRITRADRLDVAYFAQHQLDELNPGASAYDHLRLLMADSPEARVRARAGAIGFSEAMADTPVGQLSGGEKSRLLLGLATLAGTHLVILDEPTNHLDIDSRAALVAGINAYPGAVIIVSHDRYLIEACADRLWLVGDGRVMPFDGDIDDYRRFVLNERNAPGEGSERAAKGAKPNNARAEVRRAAAQLRIETAPLRRRIAAAETAVKRQTEEIARIDLALAAPGLFARDPGKAATLAKARAEAAAALARAEDEWLAASTELDAASA